MTKNYTKFKIFPIKGHKEYYDVYIFRDRISMRLFSSQLFHKTSYMRFEAMTHSFEARHPETNEVANVIGAVLFYEGGFGYGVVSHEMAHAANYYFMRNKVDFNLGSEPDSRWQEGDEMYAWCLGYLNNQFWKKYNKSRGQKNLYERY